MYLFDDDWRSIYFSVAGEIHFPPPYQTLWYNAQYHIRKWQDHVYVKGEYYVMNKALFETWK